MLRVPLKNSFDTFFSQFIDENVDDIINDEENIVDVIHALRGMTFYYKYNFKSFIIFTDVVFPNDAEDKE